MVRQLTFDGEKVYATHFYIASKKNYYTISTSATKVNTSAELARFLNSIEIGGKTLLRQNRTATASQTQGDSTPRIIEKLESSPEVKAALRKECSGKIRYGYETNAPKGLQVETKDYSRSLLLLKKPKAQLSSRPSGEKVRLRVLFQADGCVVAATVIIKSSEAETMAAIRAASQIKFLPAEIAGKPVDKFSMVEYSF